MSAFMCQYPDHEGDRLVRYRQDQFIKKQTYYRTDGQLRMHERPVDNPNRCKACVLRETSDADTNQGTLL